MARRIGGEPWHTLLALLAASLCALAIGTLIAVPAIPVWYATLPKPSWTPPNGVFGPVWTVLYLAMAYAAWRVWAVARPRLRWLYAAQLTLAAAWPLAFFGLRQPALALADNLLLAGAVALTGFSFWRRDALAGLIFIPYLMWVVYAAALTAAIVVLSA